MKEQINKLFKERSILYERIMKLDKAIKALQDICEHDWQDDGRDSHKDHYKCSICGATDSY